MKRAEPLLFAAVALGLLVLQATAQTANKEKDGKWEAADGTPTFNIRPDGTVDWYTYSGFRRYHSKCIGCHGPDGEASGAPALTESMKTMTYADFVQVVASGRQVVGAAKEGVWRPLSMHAFGDNPNVMCYIDDMYVYLKARAEGALPRGRPLKRAPKPATAYNYEKACFGGK